MRRPRRRTQARQVSIPAPVRGIVENVPPGMKDGSQAEFIENFLPTVRGLKVRGGTAEHASVANGVVTLMTYISGASNQLFAATADAVYEVTSSSTEDTEIVSGLASGKWAVQQIGTSGGEYLVLVNGSNHAHLFDGTNFVPLVDVAVNGLAYDGLTTDFALGETLTGGTSGATAEIVGVKRTTATTGTVYLGTITGGPYVDDEAITSTSGAAVANGANSVANSITVTGSVSTDDLTHVWSYRDRLFFVEKETQKAWYLPTGSVGGAANDINLAGVFQRGGDLLFGATWSLDSGDGLDDKCVFFSTLGEVAVYSGSDPSDASNWALEGRYDIGKPLSDRAHIRVGGDILIATDDGIVPLSAALTKDPADLSLAAVSRNIKSTWNLEVARAGDCVQLVKWTGGETMIVVLPQATRVLTANLQTGAWATQTGWDGECAVELADDVYVGMSTGLIKKINTTGADQGAAFIARACGAFSDLGDPISYKQASMMRAAYFADAEFGVKYSVSTDYDIQFPPPPAAVEYTTNNLIWGSGNWDEQVWALDIEDPAQGVTGRWAAVAGAGQEFAPVIQIASGSTERLPVELVRIDFLVEQGGRAV